MTTILQSQAATYATQAGFSGGALATILGIANAESSLNTLAYNGNDPYGGSYGVLQINGAHMGESFVYGNHTYIMSPSIADNPLLAFAFAYQLSGGGVDFTPWGTYTSGAYLSGTVSSSSGTVSGVPVSSVPDTINNVNTLNTLTSGLSSPDIWVRLGISLVGIALIVTGTVAVVKGVS